MLIQLHWQNRSNFHETQFVAQDEIRQGRVANDVLTRFQEIIEARKDECPAGWIPMVCTEDAKEFVLAVNKQS